MKMQWIAGLMAAAMVTSVPVCAEDAVSAALKISDKTKSRNNTANK